MPWQTPTLATVRQNNRDYIVARLRQPLIPNDYPRFLADANAGNAHLNLQYLDWLATQLLPDTAEQQFLDKWANIYLVNADGSRGRKVSTFAAGTITVAATLTGTVLPAGSILTALSGSSKLSFQTTTATTLAASPTPVPIRALTSGAAANLVAGTALSLSVAVSGVDGSSAIVVSLAGGADQETDDELRVRVLFRIQNPPMGGDANDYEGWALEVAGVTRAWCAPNEQGVGTVTLRVMCDDLRASSGGLPTAADLAAVQAYVNTVRPVTVKEFFVVAPVFQPIDFAVTNLQGDSVALRAAIAKTTAAMLFQRARPSSAMNGILQAATTIPAAWISEAIYSAVGGVFFDLVASDVPPVSNGSLAVLGTIG
jgi:uncharacterized phage protein gp47/JayE